MAKLIKGHVQNFPVLNYSKAGKPILKFNVQVGDNYWMRQPVVVFGDKAELHQDLVEGEYVVLSGELKENTYREETTIELIIGWNGNIQRHRDKPKKVIDHPASDDANDAAEPEDGEVVSAPRSHFLKSAQLSEPDYEDCPEYESPVANDSDYQAYRDERIHEFLGRGFHNDNDIKNRRQHGFDFEQ